MSAGAGDPTGRVTFGLNEAAAAFGGGADHVELVHAPRVWEVDDAGDTELGLAIELVYEGYLLHYRDSRLLPPATPGDRRLLAGDYFYAHGLSLIAGGEDTARVGLLTRLMAACAYLRAERIDLAVDDQLWELVVRGVAAPVGTRMRRAAVEAMQRFDEAIRAARPARLAAAATLGLEEVRRGEAVP